MNEGSCKKPIRSSQVIFLALFCNPGHFQYFTYMLTLRNLVCYRRQSIQGSVTGLLNDPKSMRSSFTKWNIHRVLLTRTINVKVQNSRLFETYYVNTYNEKQYTTFILHYVLKTVFVKFFKKQFSVNFILDFVKSLISSPLFSFRS